MSSEKTMQELTALLPFLRRYARALTGSQTSGDRYALATLEVLVEEPDALGDENPKVDLFSAFHKIWQSSGAPIADEDDQALLENRAQWRLQGLMANSREALLLHSIEGFSFQDIASIMGIEPADAEKLVEQAASDIDDMVTGNVMIIEDEAIIAMDLEAIVRSMGHTVTGVARTADAAVKLGEKTVPDLIMADIQLADGSSGIDAVNALLESLGDRPVIFITAFPERLLTGERPEPAFLISKPYAEEQVRTAVSQAMFFATTEEMQTA